MQKLWMAAALAAALSGCASDGSLYRSDVYQASQVNQAQNVRTVQIVALNSGKVAVNNEEARGDAQTIGTVFGALAGAVVGNQVQHSNTSRVVGAGVGGVLGNLAGATAGGKSQQLVDGVQITFRDGKNLFNSAQVGQLCEFKLGSAILVSQSATETRIQPNNPNGCPKK